MPRRVARIWLHIRAMGLHARRLARRRSESIGGLKSPAVFSRQATARRAPIRRLIRRLVLILRLRSGRLVSHLAAATGGIGDRWKRGLSLSENRSGRISESRASDNPLKTILERLGTAKRDSRSARSLVSRFGRQTVWSVAAVTGTVVLLLMLILQLSPMLAAHRAQSNDQANKITVAAPVDEPEIERDMNVSVAVDVRDDVASARISIPQQREPAEDDPFAERSGTASPKPKPVATGISVQPRPEPALDVRLLRLSPLDPDGSQISETEFRVSATTMGQSDWSPGLQIELSEGASKLSQRTTPFLVEQKTNDDDWRPLDSRRRRNLSRPLLTRGNRVAAADVRRDTPAKEVFGPTRQSTAMVVTRVVASKLKLTVTFPERLSIGNRCPIRFRITNGSNGPTTGVLVHIELPPALAYSKGASLEYLVETIPAGKSRDARLTPRAISAGMASFTVRLIQSGRIVVQSEKSVQIATPSESRPTATGILVPCPCEEFPPLPRRHNLP